MSMSPSPIAIDFTEEMSERSVKMNGEVKTPFATRDLQSSDFPLSYPFQVHIALRFSTRCTRSVRQSSKSTRALPLSDLNCQIFITIR